MTKQKQIN